MTLFVSFVGRWLIKMEISLNEIKKLVAEIAGCEEIEIDSSDNLIDTGIIDSLMVMEIIDYFEERYQIEFPPESIIPENFETIDRLYQMLIEILK